MNSYQFPSLQWASQLGAWWQADFSLDLSSTALVAGVDDDDDGDDDGDDEDDNSTVEFDMQCDIPFSFPSSFRQLLFLNC